MPPDLKKLEESLHSLVSAALTNVRLLSEYSVFGRPRLAINRFRDGRNFAVSGLMPLTENLEGMCL